MKILFVDQSSDLQEKWIEPLRKKGWGVVRARSVEDATRMMTLHGEALEAIVVGERFVAFAEKQGMPFIVLTATWNENAILKHQNSANAAAGYLSLAHGMEELYALFEAGLSRQMKATGTDGVPVNFTEVKHASAKPAGKADLKLQDYSGILSKPEKTSTGSLSLSLEAPTIVLGGKNAIPEVEVAFSEEPIVLAAAAPLKMVDPFEETSGNHAVDSFENRTVILDATSLQMESSGLNELPEAEGLVEIESLDSLISDEVVEDMNDDESLEIQFTPPESPVHAPMHAQHYSAPMSQFSVNPAPIAGVTDSETLRSYLALREQDVAVLSGQVRSSQERIQQLENLLKVEKARNTELAHMNAKQEQQLKHYDQEKQVEHEVLERQIEDVNDQLKERTDKARKIEAKLRITMDEIGKVKERVRVDIRRIRVREKELEGQLEVLKKDSSALLQARDDKILELKRRLDLLEFNMELVQEQFYREKETADLLKMKLKDAALVMKQAGGLLEQ